MADLIRIISPAGDVGYCSDEQLPVVLNEWGWCRADDKPQPDQPAPVIDEPAKRPRGRPRKIQPTEE